MWRVMWRDLRSLAGASDILITWTIREVKVRYADTRLGIGWLLVYPAAWVLLFTFLFSYLVPIPVNGAPYPVFVMSGLVPWFFFSNSTSNAVSSLKNNSNLIPKVYFPREILPLGSVLVGLVDLCLYLVMLAGLMLYYRTRTGLVLILLIPIVVTLAALTLAISLLASRLALFRRDVQLLVPLALQFLMYCVPTFYPIEIVPSRFRTLYLLNPLAALMDGLRRILVYDSWPRWPSLLIAAGVSFAFLGFAYRDFKKAEPEFADRL
jgi:lipopolysaccharide transport system permease protein